MIDEKKTPGPNPYGLGAAETERRAGSHTEDRPERTAIQRRMSRGLAQQQIRPHDRHQDGSARIETG